MSTNTSTLLQHYEVIAEITRNMLELALVNEWDEVVSLSERYVHAVDQLREVDTLSATDRAARRQLLSRILENDAQIRHLAMPELGRLNQLLGNMKRQQDVLQAYCAPSINHA
ncbi:flagellar protein FliT [Paenalcaligenes niemegkensis]|uniref:flagellar protein FliT n=1 Tax=Paenalcaligenes niemegkensis TaxID=2895469 RepID=UPI001EE810D5|nr:flagellar protein FliT [Paenalcaligenes niemegkensis]MCQ9616014.1 flagellar protein FliT [Paenalcaligenes niemegkensis]